MNVDDSWSQIKNEVSQVVVPVDEVEDQDQEVQIERHGQHQDINRASLQDTRRIMNHAIMYTMLQHLFARTFSSLNFLPTALFWQYWLSYSGHFGVFQCTDFHVSKGLYHSAS